jgi:hypothetical protein
MASSFLLPGGALNVLRSKAVPFVDFYVLRIHPTSSRAHNKK